MEIFQDFVINILAGLVGAMVVLWAVERKRRPSLKFVVETPPYKGQNRIHLRVIVHNQKLQFPLSWIYDREAAQLCRAWISFHHLDGRRYFSKDMVGRWCETPEPVELQIIDGQIMWGPSNRTCDYVDIAPGTTSTLDVVFKYDGEDNCYGWNNEAYRHKEWRNPEWELSRGRYLVKVKVKTGGREFSQSFELFNEGDFRLEIRSSKS
jgi:hypothetical protein